MNTSQFIIKDICSRRNGSEIYFGILTIVIATVILIFSMAFKEGALKIIDSLIDRTYLVSGIIQVNPPFGGYFTIESKRNLEKKIEHAMNQTGSYCELTDECIRTLKKSDVSENVIDILNLLKEDQLVKKNFLNILETEKFFKLTELSLKSLKNEGIPEHILSKLEKLKSQIYIGMTKFTHDFESIISEKEIISYKSLILQHSAIKIDEIERTLILAHSNKGLNSIEYITKLENMRFVNQDGSPINDVGVWAVRYQSDLLNMNYDFNILKGNTLINKTGLRFGVMINSNFLKEKFHYDDTQINNLLKSDPFDFKIHLRIGTVIYRDENGSQKDEFFNDLKIPVVSLFKMEMYPDLIVTPEVAAACFSEPVSDDKVEGLWKADYAFQFVDYNDGKPFLQYNEIITERSIFKLENDKKKLLECNNLVEKNLLPYNEARILLKDWKNSETRKLLSDFLESKQFLLKTNDTEMIEKIKNELKSKENKHSILRIIRKLFNNHSIMLTAKRLHDIIKVDDTNYVSIFSDELNPYRFEFNNTDNSLSVYQTPPWRVNLPQLTTMNALLKTRDIIIKYSTIINITIACLSSASILLLSLCHILRKQSEIGLLFMNGSTKGRIFKIYTGEVGLICLIGILFGTILSVVFCFPMEIYAKNFLISFSEELSKSRILVEGYRALPVNIITLMKAFPLLFFSGLLGAVYPSIMATKTDPLSSMNKGV
ncbi:MAG: ABC transporter permease [Desulfobacterales bacterium]|nr:ABC transporter permease [Desulfobacterales bacterium]